MITQVDLSIWSLKRTHEQLRKLNSTDENGAMVPSNIWALKAFIIMPQSIMSIHGHIEPFLLVLMSALYTPKCSCVIVTLKVMDLVETKRN